MSAAAEPLLAPQDIVAYMVKSFVTFPEDVVIWTGYHGRRETVHVQVNPEDKPKTIGSRGRHAQAMRTLMQCLGYDIRIEIE